MKQGKGLIVKIGVLVFLALTVVLSTISISVSVIIKEEVLEQWKTKDSRLVDVYGQLLQAKECDTVEEYQEFIDDINEENSLNYALFIQDIDGQVTAVAHSNPDRIGLVLEDEGSIAAARDGEAYVGYYTDQVTGGLTLDVLTPIYNEEQQLEGALNIGIPVDEKTMNGILGSSMLKVGIISGICTVVLLIVLSVFIFMVIVKPIKKIGDNISRMAKYDFTPDTTGVIEKYCKRSDEIGMISEDFESMRISITKLVGEITAVVEQLAGRADSLSEVSEKVSETGRQLSQTVNEVANGATSQAQETVEGQQQVGELSQLIELVQENMDVLNQATKAVSEIKDQGVEALKVVVENTEKNTEDSSRMHEVIMETSRQTDKIKEASSQIRDIAEQTNLLALNASIEAARAGEAGKGFAVVATEIGNLAGGTNELTSRIEEIIQDLVKKMEVTVSVIENMQEAAEVQTESVKDTGEKFESIAENIQNMEQRCQQLYESTQKMEERRQALVSVVNNMSAIAEENAACMEEAAASVEEQARTIESVSESSHHVASLADKLTEEIHHFKVK